MSATRQSSKTSIENLLNYESSSDSEQEDYTKDPDYNPANDSQEDTSSSEDESDLDADEEEHEQEEDKQEEHEQEDEQQEEEDYKNDPDYIPEDDDDYEASSGDEDSDDIEINQVEGEEKPSECTDCHYEWLSGWKKGWKAAMKHVKQQLITPPSAPICANCNISRKTKKCAGSCEGIVRYCSEQCQREHWISSHKFSCSKKQN